MRILHDKINHPQIMPGIVEQVARHQRNIIRQCSPSRHQSPPLSPGGLPIHSAWNFFSVLRYGTLMLFGSSAS